MNGDDDRDVRETLADAVESMGRLVFTAADGAEERPAQLGAALPRGSGQWCRTMDSSSVALNGFGNSPVIPG
jgi:hypothetical protein